MSSKTDEKLDILIGLLSAQAAAPAAAPAAPAHMSVAEYETVTNRLLDRAADPVVVDEETIYQRFKARLMKEAPSLLRVLNQTHGIQVIEQRETIEIDGKSLRGRLALLILKGFFDQLTSANSAYNEFKRVGFSIAKPSVYSECDKLTTMGFLIKEPGGYQAVVAMKSSIKKAA